MTAVAVTRPWRPAQSAPHAVRKEDFYETHTCATHALLRTGEIKRLAGAKTIWEPSAGKGAISRELTTAGHHVVASDLVAYEGADDGIETPVDFLATSNTPTGAAVIVTNPPYRHADDFVRHGLALGLPVVVLLRLMALEGSNRSDLIDRHLRRVRPGIERLPMMHREGWQGPRATCGGAPFAWFVFMPGVRRGPFEMQRISWREGVNRDSRPASASADRDDCPARNDADGISKT
jgi:hypothetical protein